MKLFTWLRFLPLAIGLSLFSSCSVPLPLNDLTIGVEAIKPGPGGSHGDVELSLHIVNGNEVAAAMARSTHKLYLAGNYVGKAEIKSPIALPRMSTRTEKVNLHVENAGALDKAIAGASNAVPYRLDSEVFYDVEEEHVSTKLTQSGTLDIHSLTN